MVILIVLGNVPAVKCLLHHQHAEPIARIEEHRRHRVVGGADRVVAKSLEQLYLPLLGAIVLPAVRWHGGCSRHRA